MLLGIFLSLCLIPNVTLLVELSPKTTMEGTNMISKTISLDVGDHSLDSVINSLVPSFREASSPIPILTFLRKEFIIRAKDTRALGDSSSIGEGSGKNLAWSQGLGIEVSPIKTRSACKKTGKNISFFAQQLTTNLEQGALRGMKSLPRAKL